MPTLEGLPDSAEVIRTYYPFYISTLEQVNAINLRPIIQQYTQRGVVNVCSNCTQNGYYIVGLEKGVVIQGTPPELYKALAQRPDVITYTLTLGLFVRRFATKLTGDELYYWSKQSSERILFEMNQLESRTFSDGQSIFTKDYTTISDDTITIEKLNSTRRMIEQTAGIDPRKFLAIDTAVETGYARSIEKSESEKREQVKNKVQQYKIIRRPKCSTQTS